MSFASAESLVEQRVAQLEAISTRRNELLRQMYHMMRRRNNVGSVLTLDEADEGDLQSFLQRFDIVQGLDIGSITNLSENEQLSEIRSQSLTSFLTPSPTLDKGTMRRTTRSQSRVASLTKSPSPSPSKQSVAPVSLSIVSLKSPPGQEVTKIPLVKTPLVRDMDVNDDRDELDLIGSPLSDDEEKKPPATPQPGNVDPKEPSLLHWSPQPGVDGGTQAAEHDGDSMNVDEPIAEESVSNAETAGPVTSSDLGTSQEGQEKSSIEDSEMKDSENEVDDSSEEEVSRTVDRPSHPAQLVTSFSSDAPIKSSIPFMPPGSSSPIQIAPIPRPPIVILAPSTSEDITHFTFDESLFAGPEQAKIPNSPLTHRHQYNPNYSLPLLKSLPPEFNRKVKTKSRRKEREREKEGGKEKENGKKEDSFPMGINRWAATLNANPVWKRVSRPSKCLSSREWAVAMAELKLIRTFDRIESLKDGGRWSFRQPKKQRGVGGLAKTHWDYLMDEMKWMRIDFREERRWKMALAYTLATAVMDWHAAGSLEERVKRGICVLWDPGYVKSEADQDDSMQDGDGTQPEVTISQESETGGRTASTLLGVDYGSDEDEDEDQQDVVDALQPQAMLEEALEVPLQEEIRVDQTLIKPKTEETDDTSALQFINDSTQPDTQPVDEDMDQPMANLEEKETKEGVTGLKLNSTDPILGAKAGSNSSSNNGDSDTPAISSKTSMKQAYVPLRERILESELDKLFLDLDDFHITQPRASNGGDRDPIDLNLLPADLSTIFPELQPLGLLDVAPPIAPVPEGRKKSDKRTDRDDPNKRIEDTTYTKLFPAGQFMLTKPTLIGPLQPSKNWKDGRWLALDEPPIFVEYEGPTRPPEDAMSEIFDNRLSNSTVLAQQQLMFAAARERDKGRRTTEHQWSANDDTLLKSLIDRYPYNWQLISESFNATRVTTPTDKRTARDCFERWREKWAPEVRRHPETQPQQAPPATATEESVLASTSQMTTRGVKRLASSMATAPATNTSSGSEPKKRRRHILLQETIRRSVKKKAEFQQKMLGNQRKPSTIHETHGPFNNMRFYSPSELSRMKAEKDAKATQEIQLRRRQEEVTRAAIQARLTPAQQQSLVQQQLQQQLLQQATQQQNQQTQQPGTPVQAPAQVHQQPSQQAGQKTPQPAPTQVQQAAVAQPAAQQVSQQAQVANIAQRSQNALLANQALGNIRGQVNISRINSPSVAAGAPRLTPQQLLQFQQAQQVRPGSQPTQPGQVAAHPLAQQAQIIVPSLNGNGTALNGAHLTAPFVNRDSTSSPAHVSPPRKSATPTNVNSPRITTEQVQHGQVQMGMLPNTQVAGSVMARATPSYYNIPGLTQEQLSVLRMQLMQQQQQQQAQQQQQNTQQDSSGQVPTSNGFSS
ncbi:hypothetical protein P691DRAFT_771618 [Macrolepiota fuliginosa MF-IS2]|uniref:Vacuolar import and degradation protein 21 n=1 Tax=Macrolepiota fuliginosa MF-IS2 TaxID=1400762 RepID=A0A9P5XKU7_9AGAR|nr:hypothetical protein P691DRAFT_771618 [Macrolepiota fuliginosa MF-IS2]